MYPRNASNPERILVGTVVQISDGAIQTSGVTVTVTPQGGSETSGVGTVAYSARGSVWYTPTQAETNYPSFMVEAGKTGCFPVGVSVVTTASATPGYAALDWALIANKTTTHNLSATTIKTATDVETDTADIQSRIPAALVSGRIDASVGAMASGVVTATAIATDAIGAAELAADAITEIATGVWAAAARTLTAGTNITLAKGTGITGFNDLDAAGVRTAVGLASANLDTQFSALAAFVDTEVAAIKAKTDNLPSDPADASDIAAAFSTVNSTLATLGGYIDTEVAAVKVVTDKLDTALEADGPVYRYTANALEQAPSGSGLDAAGVRAALGMASADLDDQLAAVPTATENADALLNRDMAAVSDTNSRSPLNALRFVRNGFSIAGSTLTVLKEDDTTAAFTRDLTTDANADPITGVN